LVQFIILLILNMSFYFFFQAEDGIRDATVTGVQTCALPICAERDRPRRDNNHLPSSQPGGPNSFNKRKNTAKGDHTRFVEKQVRSEERRVGKECRSQ